MKKIIIFIVLTSLAGCAFNGNSPIVDEDEKRSLTELVTNARSSLSGHLTQQNLFADKDSIGTPFLWKYGRVILDSELDDLKRSSKFNLQYEKGWVSADYLYVYRSTERKVIPLSERSLFPDLITRIQNKINDFHASSAILSEEKLSDLFVIEVINNKTGQSHIYLQETLTGRVRGVLM